MVRAAVDRQFIPPVATGFERQDNRMLSYVKFEVLAL